MALASRWLWLPVFLAAALALGQEGIPVEDGGEIETVSALGGVNHPPGMPLLSLLGRTFWLMSPEWGLRLLFALLASISVLLLTERAGVSGRLLGLLVLALPAFGERLLAWDAYGPLFLLAALSLLVVRSGTTGRSAILTGYIAGLGCALHLQGLMLLLPALLCARGKAARLAQAVLGFGLALSLYLLLPISSSAGLVVDWGSCGSLSALLRQVTAAGYREVYEGIGRLSTDTLALHLGTIWRLLWPGLLLPVLALLLLSLRPARGFLAPVLRPPEATSPFGRRDRRAAAPVLGLLLASLVLLDLVFVLLVNPMAAGTSQTGAITLLVLIVLGIEGLRRLRHAAAAVVLGFALVLGLPFRSGLPDQEAAISNVLAGSPMRTALVLESNDLLYGCWSACYARDARPDVVLMSTQNFSGWFEDMVSHFHPGFDLSASVLDVGGYDLPRDVVAGRLIQAAIEANPGYTFLSDR